MTKESMIHRAVPVAWLAVAATLALATSASGAPAADTVTVDFETGPNLGTPVTDQYPGSEFRFWQRADTGFRPHRRVAGVATQSGIVAADIGPDHCYPDEADDPAACEFPVAGTSGLGP